MGGGGADFTLGHFGVVSLAAAASRFSKNSGRLTSVSFERNASVVSFSASVQSATPTFSDIAGGSGQPVPLLQTRASIGLTLGNFGSFGLAYVGLRGQAVTAAQQTASTDQQYATVGYGFNSLSLLPPTNVNLVSVSYSRSMFSNRAFLYSTAFHDFANASTSGLLVGVSVPIGQRSSAGASFDGESGNAEATFQASQSAVNIGDFGWQSQFNAGSESHQLAVGEYKSPWGLVDAGIDRNAGQTTLRATAQGAVAVAGGGVFASNAIRDSFAVVDTESKDIQVLQENRPVGRTGSSGLLLVPDLRSFGANRLGIDPTNVPVDSDIGLTSRMVRPQDHSGVVVKFPVHSSSGAVVRLVDASGTTIPVGSIAKLTTSAESAELIVGYDGDAYVTGLQPKNTLSVKLPNGHTCTASFGYKPVPGTLPEIGQVHCLESAP
jgi:outer membrane usher protein